MSYIPTLLHAIETRLDQTTTEITHLEAALSALAAPTTTATVARPAKSGTTKQGQRASTKPTAAAPDTASPDRPDPIADGAVTTARTTRRRPAAASASGRRRATAKLNPETLERLLASTTAGLSATQIAEQAGASYPATLKLLRELEASGQVRRSGERRSTSWRVITDEERIAERVAELERAATAPGRRRGRARAS